MRFEARLILLTCVFASALVHALGVFFSYTAQQRPPAVMLEFIVPVDEEEEEPPPVLTAGASEASEGDALPGAGDAPPPRGWRARWRAKEARFKQDAIDQAVNLARLDETRPGGAGDEAPVAPPLALCTKSGHKRIVATSERDVGHWGAMVPTGLFQASYTEGMTLVKRSGPKLGAVEFALPARVSHIPLDLPVNGVVEAGRNGVRCLIGITYSPGVFPITIRGIPSRLATEDGIREAVVDVELLDDGTFNVTNRDGDMGVTRGAVYNHDTVGRKLRMFYSGAALFMR